MRKRKILDPRKCGYGVEVQVTQARDEGLLQAWTTTGLDWSRRLESYRTHKCQAQGKWFYETGMLLAPFP